MKSFIVVALFIAGICALPQQLQLAQQLNKGLYSSDERLVTNSIASAIEGLSQRIVDAGLDPLYLPGEQASYALPVPVLFSASGGYEDLLSVGLSNIVIKRLSFNSLTFRLRLDLQLPLVETTLKKAESSVTLFGEEINTSLSGRLAVRDVNFNADVRIRVGIISGVSISSLDLALSIGAIDSELAVSALGKDLSPVVNNFLGNTVPNTLNQFQSEINELLEIVILDLINQNL